TEHHQFMLRLLWKQLAQEEELIAELDARINDQVRPLREQVERLDAVPGVDRRVAVTVLAEVGADMKPFPSDGNLASWAGMCPGNDVSAAPLPAHTAPPLLTASEGATAGKGMDYSERYERYE
ncbi:MAG TPA: transposase, partial [Terriglobia bacterium]|nr:transposase [Terriglobia bacterium]